MRAELTREVDGALANGKGRVFAWSKRCLDAADPGRAMPVVRPMDGERAPWETPATYLAGVVCIRDAFHVLGRLWRAAHCSCPAGSDAAQAFVTRRLKRAPGGDVGRVTGGLEQMATKHGLRGAKLTQPNQATGYVHDNRRSTRHDRYLAAGCPIGRGVAEGACRHLARDRMGRTGMRWVVPAAQAMLDPRAVHAGDRRAEFQADRIDAERRRLYPDQE